MEKYQWYIRQCRRQARYQRAMAWITTKTIWMQMQENLISVLMALFILFLWCEIQTCASTRFGALFPDFTHAQFAFHSHCFRFIFLFYFHQAHFFVSRSCHFCKCFQLSFRVGNMASWALICEFSRVGMLFFKGTLSIIIMGKMPFHQRTLVI